MIEKNERNYNVNDIYIKKVEKEKENVKMLCMERQVRGRVFLCAFE